MAYRTRADLCRASIQVLALTCVLLLSACSTTPVVATSEFPTPVLRKVPVNMGLYMDEAFRTYTYTDKPAKGSKQEVSVGPASRALFNEFLKAQFATLTVLGQAPEPGRVPTGVQAVLQPQIQEVQIASPTTDKDEFHEAWIKYRLRLSTPQGQELTSWELSAYGKQRAAMIGGGNSGLTAAVREAMRDAAAGMALIFRNGDAFRTRLLAASAASGAPGPPIAAPSGEAIPAALPSASPPPGAKPAAPAPKKSAPVIFGSGSGPGSVPGRSGGVGSGIGSGGSSGPTFP